MRGYGYKDSHSQTIIPKYSPTFRAWRMGDVKPKEYRGFIWELTIEYFERYEERETPDIFRQAFPQKHREYACNTRDLMVPNLMLDGKTVKNVYIRLVRV